MNVFKSYAQYYDLLYYDKNYAAEVDYVDGLIKEHMSMAASVLDVGCGTGRHATLLAQKGYNVHGIDLSTDMIDTAQRLSFENKSLAFSCADARDFNLNKTFDVVVSLFHVMSYQITNDDIKKAFTCAHKHLKPGGLFIFDCWYGPAVLTERPLVRVKRVENDQVKIVRIAEPMLHTNKNCVDVKFTVYVHDKQRENIQQLEEVHTMRYFFEPEIQLLLEHAGFKYIDVYEWLGRSKPHERSWGACFVVRK